MNLHGSVLLNPRHRPSASNRQFSSESLYKLGYRSSKAQDLFNKNHPLPKPENLIRNEKEFKSSTLLLKTNKERKKSLHKRGMWQSGCATRKAWHHKFNPNSNTTKVHCGNKMPQPLPSHSHTTTYTAPKRSKSLHLSGDSLNPTYYVQDKPYGWNR